MLDDMNLNFQYDFEGKYIKNFKKHLKIETFDS